MVGRKENVQRQKKVETIMGDRSMKLPTPHGYMRFRIKWASKIFNERHFSTLEWGSMGMEIAFSIYEVDLHTVLYPSLPDNQKDNWDIWFSFQWVGDIFTIICTCSTVSYFDVNQPELVGENKFIII